MTKKELLSSKRSLFEFLAITQGALIVISIIVIVTMTGGSRDYTSSTEIGQVTNLIVTYIVYNVVFALTASIIRYILKTLTILAIDKLPDEEDGAVESVSNN